ncbi:MAG TPA: hypothetical protein VFL64_00135 [Rhizobacter sp.]|nr:hypothetical protein [Rhizobacter sp.]
MLQIAGGVTPPPPIPDFVPPPPLPPMPPPGPDVRPPDVIDPPAPGQHEPVREPTRHVPEVTHLH